MIHGRICIKENRIVVSTENYKGMKDFATNENLALKKCSEYINKKRSSISRYSSVNKLIGILIDKCNAFNKQIQSDKQESRKFSSLYTANP